MRGISAFSHCRQKGITKRLHSCRLSRIVGTREILGTSFPYETSVSRNKSMSVLATLWLEQSSLNRFSIPTVRDLCTLPGCMLVDRSGCQRDELFLTTLKFKNSLLANFGPLEIKSSNISHTNANSVNNDENYDNNITNNNDACKTQVIITIKTLSIPTLTVILITILTVMIRLEIMTILMVTMHKYDQWK